MHRPHTSPHLTAKTAFLAFGKIKEFHPKIFALILYGFVWRIPRNCVEKCEILLHTTTVYQIYCRVYGSEISFLEKSE
jgi:hypothetical protein